MESRLGSLGSAVGLVVVAFVAGNVVLLTAAVLLETVGVAVFGRPGRLLFLSVVVLQGITFGGIALAYLGIRGLGQEFVGARLPNLRDLGIATGAVVLLFALLAAVNVVVAALGVEPAGSQIIEIGGRNPALFPLLIPLSFLLVGPGEELLFRGIVQGTLMESYRPVPAILLASGLFAIPHVFSLTGQGKPISIGIVFLLALVLGASYEYSGNILVPSVVHGAFNAVQFGGAYLLSTGSI